MKKHHQPSPQQRVRSRLRIAATMALVASMMASSYYVYGHGGDFNHDLLLDSIPDGVTTLLPDNAKNPTLHGFVGPLIPMHTMSVHNTLTFKKNSRYPSMLMFHRHSGYTADEVSNPDVIDFLIKNPNPSAGVNAFGSSANQFNSSMRRSFQQFAYGGYNIIHDVSQSVPTRMGVDQTRELCQLWDMNHPSAFSFDYQNPKYSAAQLLNTDASMNVPAFKDMGPSRGLYYDMYCPGFSTLEDGRPVFMGGHDMNSQNGSYRIQIFDPETETWATRPASCMRQYFGRDSVASAFRVSKGLEADDWNLEKYYRKKMDEFQAANTRGTPLTAAELRSLMTGVYLPDCNPHLLPTDGYSPTYEGIRLAGDDGTITHPGKLTSDMKYARWYPGQITLPGNKIFVYAGWDRDESFFPQNTATPSTQTTAMQPFMDIGAPTYTLPVNAELSGFMKAGGDNDFLNSRVKQVVPEVYDGATDTMHQLENAPLFHNAWYPNGLVIQTGPGRNDWKVAVNDADLLGNVASDVSLTRKDANGAAAPIGAHKPAGSVQNRHYHNTWVLDLQAALKDPTHNDTQPSSIIDSKTSKYWTYLADAPSSHSEFTGNANIMELDKLGRVISHKLTHVGGQYPISTATLKTAIAAGVTELPLVAALPVEKALYIVDTGTLAETVTVIGVTKVDSDGDGTADTFTALLNAPTVRAHAISRTVSVNGTSKNVEEIDFAVLSKKAKKGETLAPPTWSVVGELYQPGRQNYCTPLPDGTVMILGGNGGNLPGIERWSLHTQLYTPGLPYNQADPASANSVKRMAKSLIPRDEHGIIQLMPDATVYLGGQNRNGLVQAGDPVAPLGDSDLGVPCGQLFQPPYLFDEQARLAQRPLITRAPSEITYGKPFKIRTFSFTKISGVSMIRAGSMSHSLNTDVRLVKLAYKLTTDYSVNKGGFITVYPPKLPGTAVGGYYQLFILDEKGVPSESVKVALGTEITKRVGKPASKWAITGLSLTSSR